MKWLEDLKLSEEQKKVVQDEVSALSKAHKQEIEDLQETHSDALSKVNAGAKQRYTKNMVSKAEHQATLDELAKYQNKEISSLADEDLKKLNIKEEFFQDVMDKVSSTIDYEGIEDQKGKAQHLLEETKKFLKDNERFVSDGQAPLKPTDPEKQNNNEPNDVNDVEQANIDYNAAFGIEE